jgi:hypothetical protein
VESSHWQKWPPCTTPSSTVYYRARRRSEIDDPHDDHGPSTTATSAARRLGRPSAFGRRAAFDQRMRVGTHAEIDDPHDDHRPSTINGMSKSVNKWPSYGILLILAKMAAAAILFPSSTSDFKIFMLNMLICICGSNFINIR